MTPINPVKHFTPPPAGQSDLGRADIGTADKSLWRAWVRAERQHLASRRAELAELTPILCEHVRAFLQQQGVQRVLTYRAMSGEPDLSDLQPHFELLVPRARFWPQPHLTLHPWHTATEISRFGVLQPPADAPALPLSSVQAILLPAMAFDSKGIRLGYGGGFYDRLLPQFEGLVLGVTWAHFLVDTLPREPHDCPVRWVATEQGVIEVAGQR